MARKPSILNRKLAAAAAAVVLLAGGGAAAVSAVGEGTNSPAARAHKHLHGVPLRDIALAAQYLGMPAAQLEDELRAGHSLADIARARAGRTPAGVVDTLVAAKRSRVSAAAGRLLRRVTAEVTRSGAAVRRPAGARLGLFAGRRSLVLAAAEYLGVAPVELKRRLRAGESLGEIAQSLGGVHAAAGLRGVLVGVVQTRLAAAVSAGSVTPARAESVRAHLNRRMTVLVARRRHRR